MSTNLSCQPWMQNQNDQAPCTVAQEVGQLCVPTYSVSSTNFQESQYTPNATTSNGCTCSWSIYNLLSACSYCVGEFQYTSWTTWTSQCGGNASKTSYLPPNLNFPQGIPYWATTDPSTWENATFNIIQAAAVTDHPDATGGPLPTTTSSTSNPSIGVVVGGVVGGVVAFVVGGLFIFCMVRRCQSRKVQGAYSGVSSLNSPEPITVYSSRGRMVAQPTPFKSSHAPGASTPHTPRTRSMTNLAGTLLVSPDSLDISPNERIAASVINDAADIISPFLATSPVRQTNRQGKAAEALSERMSAAPGQRGRLNPPPYSISEVPASSDTSVSTTWARRLSMKGGKKRKSSVSGATASSGRSRSTTDSVTTLRPNPQTEQTRRPFTAVTGIVRSAQSAVNTRDAGDVDAGNDAAIMHPERGVPDHPPPTS